MKKMLIVAMMLVFTVATVGLLRDYRQLDGAAASTTVVAFHDAKGKSEVWMGNTPNALTTGCSSVAPFILDTLIPFEAWTRNNPHAPTTNNGDFLVFEI